MGCDIHVFLEVRKDSKWILMNQPHVHRDYQLFGHIAGVRDDSQVLLVEPRGLPNDLSEGTQLNWDYRKEDYHTPGWLTGDEAEALSQEHSAEDNRYIHPCLFGYLFGNGLNTLSKELNITDSRLVFWFDN